MEEGREHINYFKISSALQKYTVSFLTGKETKKLHVQDLWDWAGVQKNVLISKWSQNSVIDTVFWNQPILFSN